MKKNVYKKEMLVYNSKNRKCINVIIPYLKEYECNLFNFKLFLFSFSVLEIFFSSDTDQTTYKLSLVSIFKNCSAFKIEEQKHLFRNLFLNRFF